MGATTLDKLLTDRSLPAAELLIVDESQGLEMKLIEQRAAILPEWMDLAGDLPEQMETWINAIRAKQLKYEGKLERLFARLAPPGETAEVKSLMGYVEAEDAAKVARNLEKINRAMDKATAIARIVSEAPESFVIDTKTRAFKLISGREQFQEFILKNPEFALHLVEKLIRRVRATTEDVKSLALTDVYGRLVRLLNALATPAGDGTAVVPEKLTQQAIAERVGASRDMIGKLFKDGESQAVRIPDEYRFEGTEVEFRPGPNPGEVILSPKRPKRTGSFDEFFRLRALIPPEELEGFMEDREQGGQIRDDPFE